MKNIDATVIVALIAAISAIISPVITAAINCKFQYSINLAEHQEKIKAELLNNFVNSYEAIPDELDVKEPPKDHKESSKCFSSAIILAKYYPSVRCELTRFAFLVYAKKVRCSECDDAFLECMMLIGKER